MPKQTHFAACNARSGIGCHAEPVSWLRICSHVAVACIDQHLTSICLFLYWNAVKARTLGFSIRSEWRLACLADWPDWSVSAVRKCPPSISLLLELLVNHRLASSRGFDFAVHDSTLVGLLSTQGAVSELCCGVVCTHESFNMQSLQITLQLFVGPCTTMSVWTRQRAVPHVVESP